MDKEVKMIQKLFVCLHLHLLAVGEVALMSVNKNTIKYTVLSKKETILLQKAIYKNNNYIYIMITQFVSNLHTHFRCSSVHFVSSKIKC